MLLDQHFSPHWVPPLPIALLADMRKNSVQCLRRPSFLQHLHHQMLHPFLVSPSSPKGNLKVAAIQGDLSINIELYAETTSGYISTHTDNTARTSQVWCKCHSAGLHYGIYIQRQDEVQILKIQAEKNSQRRKTAVATDTGGLLVADGFLKKPKFGMSQITQLLTSCTMVW